MKKLISLLLCSLAAICICGCGSGEADSEEAYFETTIAFEKDGAVNEVIVESFNEPYYTIEGLEAFFREKISEYNSEFIGDGSVELNEITVENGTAVAKLHYDSADTYKNFNATSAFFGSISDAYDSGYITEMVLKSYDSADTITKNDLMNMSDKNIIVVSEVVRVVSPGKIAYTSANVDIIDDHTVRVSSDSTGLAYIVMK